MLRFSLENYVTYFRNQRSRFLLEQERERFVQDSIAQALELQLQAEAEAEAERARRRAAWQAKQRAEQEAINTNEE
jgi:hypothetical protein